MSAVVYRVTIDVDADAADEWLAWMRAEHVPEVLREPGFARATLARVVPGFGGEAPREDPAAPPRARFVVDYMCADRAAVEAYFAGPAARVRAAHEARFGGRARASRAVLEPLASVETLAAPRA